MIAIILCLHYDCSGTIAIKSSLTVLSSCHVLQWRKVAQELDGVIRIGAVNCEDDWMLCRQQGIRSYPSLVFYPKVQVFIPAYII